MSNRFRAVVSLATVFIAACAAIRQQRAQAPRADNLEFHNLRVLPANITHDELITTMRGFARSLGVKCNHCHVENPPESKEQFNFPLDAKPEKNVARMMIRMVGTINGNYISRINPPAPSVTCFTCHRGKTIPETSAPAETPAPRS
jgi:photosynthetic reaction center cytochrome c subunit